ncbi:hypothetical protein FVE85_1068 [Porphyridium purpureum]|uniref:Uncharacterized protein n=1 Tax=Porphyridium purpureum TaxID=35688 RepID=A0A5J4Z0F9_PORPP|nr:hypothetical protein FVE85_1068 [Porphyridium purpureum]|eukprot:POR6469..scf208_2
MLRGVTSASGLAGNAAPGLYVADVLRASPSRTLCGSSVAACKHARLPFEKPLYEFRGLDRMKAKKRTEKTLTFFGDCVMLSGTGILALKCYYAIIDEEDGSI